RARHSAIRWPWGVSQIRSLAKGEKSKRSGSRPRWRRWLSSMSFPSVSTAPARDRDGRAVVASRSKFAPGAELGTRVGAQSRGAHTNPACDAKHNVMSLPRRNFLYLATISVQRFGAIVTTPWIAPSLRADMIFREGQGLQMRRLTRLAPI